MQATAVSHGIRDDSADPIQSRVGLSVTVGPSVYTLHQLRWWTSHSPPAWEGLRATHTQLPHTHTPFKHSTGEVTHPEGLPRRAGCSESPRVGVLQGAPPRQHRGGYAPRPHGS